MVRGNGAELDISGKTLAAYLAAAGYGLEPSVQSAKDYLTGALSAMPDLGRRAGQLNHAFALHGQCSEPCS